MNIRSTLLVAAATAAPLVVGRSALTQDPAGPQFPASASAVVLDVVVRDGKGQPVHGLTAADFEVHEDGAPQSIEGFHAVAREPQTAKAHPAASAGASAAAPAPTPKAGTASPVSDSSPTMTAFVFDRLSPAGRSRIGPRSDLSRSQRTVARCAAGRC